MTGGPSCLAPPRHGACGSVPDVIVTAESASAVRLKPSGRGLGVSGASFSAAC